MRTLGIAVGMALSVWVVTIYTLLHDYIADQSYEFITARLVLACVCPLAFGTFWWWGERLARQ
jgi:hypothetical protein